MLYRWISFVLAACFLSACASTASYEEYAFAEAALSAARQMKAHTSSPSLYAKARTQFKLGRAEFRKKITVKRMSILTRPAGLRNKQKW